MPNVLSPRDLVSRPDNMDETVLSSLPRGSAVAWWLMPRTPDPEVGGSSPTRVKPCCVTRTPDPEVGGSSPTRVKPCCVLEQGAFTPQKYW